MEAINAAQEEKLLDATVSRLNETIAHTHRLKDDLYRVMYRFVSPQPTGIADKKAELSKPNTITQQLQDALASLKGTNGELTDILLQFDKIV